MNWGNRKPIVFILAIIFTMASICLLVAGILYNPSFQNLFSQKSQVKTAIGMMQTFDLPPEISFSEPATEYFGEVLCNLTTNAFVVGSPVLVTVNVRLPTATENTLYFIEVKINNAIMYQPFSEQNDTPYPCDIFIFPTNTEGAGAQTAIFVTPGILSMTIEINFEYPIGSLATFARYTTNVTFPNLQIGTGQEVQQQVTGKLESKPYIFRAFLCMCEHCGSFLGP